MNPSTKMPLFAALLLIARAHVALAQVPQLGLATINQALEFDFSAGVLYENVAGKDAVLNALVFVTGATTFADRMTTTQSCSVQ
jgi:hypothetical protein